jgi:hypothetical protein
LLQRSGRQVREEEFMRHHLIFAAAAMLLATATPTLAKDRPVTEGERSALTAAVTTAGCAGGEMEFEIDENHYEVDDAICADGRKYELDFNAEYRLFKKELEK